MAREEMATTAREETKHGTTQKDEEWPPGDGFVQQWSQQFDNVILHTRLQKENKPVICLTLLHISINGKNPFMISKMLMGCAQL
jgi:hypothetical protein